ncbi:hypothetical protein HMPREF1979_03037 [Actinomyces johnsonii F0542]|uniref:Uncharacterized protein n=1 Tax=Actinomyces johnsonii F0542 TaxID=1321818 RepID=U1Q145_9ACTO|nr:hypothetical protein HMPREF1979_03037 [Actinomyces johnsonii F0542]
MGCTAPCCVIDREGGEPSLRPPPSGDGCGDGRRDPVMAFATAIANNTHYLPV